MCKTHSAKSNIKYPVDQRETHWYWFLVLIYKAMCIDTRDTLGPLIPPKQNNT